MTKKVLASLGIAAMAGALTFTAAAPASAHSASDAIRYGCGSGFSVVPDGTRLVKTSAGLTWGNVYLAYNSATGYNCVVTNKTYYHDTPSEVSASLTVDGVGAFGAPVTYTYTLPGVLHWVSVDHYAAGHCVKFSGKIWNPAHTAYATGARTTFGNCD
ncbi:MAG TPA: hypothetical protein VM677_22065 [Actinokineospora sp.]|jgi:hypothetical protein|nr:hypothetical protein [Actinokineospora sp.]